MGMALFREIVLNNMGQKFLLPILFFCISCSDKIQSEQEEFIPIDKEIRDLWEIQRQWPLQSVVRLEAKSRILNYRDPIHIQIQAQMLTEESYLRFHLYTSDLMLNNGTSLEFKRSDKNLLVFLFSRDFPEISLCEIKNSISINGNIDLRFQFTNMDSEGPQILIWNRYFDGRDGIKKEYTYFSPKNAECSSLNKIFINHFGQGVKWGVDVYQTRINSCIRSEAL